eukprot:CAMPEP_0114995548 /NCGR_PEP_ID=MMETSP0216-20121206/13794_1 /TAXON_ID=223996 /ORGANISM="Protocruzia adherens, Strain Boccale" /LENGTH=187 /DNA_ID=CAMNT_0002359609 /DNA_START=50 /DNA_END=614 /DNA_ORIENTATION=-
MESYKKDWRSTASWSKPGVKLEKDPEFQKNKEIFFGCTETDEKVRKVDEERQRTQPRAKVEDKEEFFHGMQGTAASVKSKNYRPQNEAMVNDIDHLGVSEEAVKSMKLSSHRDNDIWKPTMYTDPKWRSTLVNSSNRSNFDEGQFAAVNGHDANSIEELLKSQSIQMRSITVEFLIILAFPAANPNG